MIRKMGDVDKNTEPSGRDVAFTPEPGVMHVGVAARVPASTPPDTQAEIRRLLLAEDAMLCVAAYARQLKPDELDRRARAVAAAGLVTMFGRPFAKDDKGVRLDPKEWRARIADDPEQARMFDRLRLRRDKVLAHSDTGAGVVNVTNTHKMFETRQPDDPLDLRVYDVGVDQGLLDPDSLTVIAALAERLADLFSKRMVELGATRRRPLR
jgi:hypothetical protein